MTTFRFNGYTYRQQYRRCGKPTCNVCKEGAGHGPYWYAVNNETKERSYIGRELTAELTRVYDQRTLIALKYNLAKDKYQTLEKVTNGDQLDQHDIEILAEASIFIPGEFREPEVHESLIRYWRGTATASDMRAIQNDPTASESIKRYGEKHPFSCVPAAPAHTQDTASCVKTSSTETQDLPRRSRESS